MGKIYPELIVFLSSHWLICKRLVMKKTTQFIFVPILIFWILFLSSCEKDKGNGLPTDGDGNEYDTVVIGTQIWLKQELRTTKLIYGLSIKLETDPSKWYSVSAPAYCWYDNVEDSQSPYGAIYNWRAASSGALCPNGWHVPTIEEWTTLINYLGGEGIAGGKLKETGTLHWVSNDEGATNETGFTALPGGERAWNGDFHMRGFAVTWWTSTPGYNDAAYCVGIGGGSHIGSSPMPSEAGFSVRCVKKKL